MKKDLACGDTESDRARDAEYVGLGERVVKEDLVSTAENGEDAAGHDRKKQARKTQFKQNPV